MVLAITFSVSDLEIIPLQSELLDLSSNNYKFAVEKHQVDCSLNWQHARLELLSTITRVEQKYGARDPNSRSLFVYYFSGHGFNYHGKDLFL